jgi:nitrogen fixation NifU-like protein
MDDLYRDYILEHYRRPHNFGVLEDPTASYEGANPLCGDRITMMLGIKDGIVSEVAFTGRGCAISQASASLLTDEIKGKTVEEVEKMTPDDLLDLIGIEISPARLKCALLSLDTVAHALADEAAKNDEGTGSRVDPAPAASAIGLSDAAPIGPLAPVRWDHRGAAADARRSTLQPVAVGPRAPVVGHLEARS